MLEIRFDPWVGKIPWSRKWQLAPGFYLGNPKDRGAQWVTTGVPKGSDMTDRLSTHTAFKSLVFSLGGQKSSMYQTLTPF